MHNDWTQCFIAIALGIMELITSKSGSSDPQMVDTIKVGISKLKSDNQIGSARLKDEQSSSESSKRQKL